jgi:cyclase
MYNFRVIPILTLKDGYLVKTIKFEEKIYVGDPVNTIKIFNEKFVDEIIILDLNKSHLDKKPDLELIRRICSQCFSPITYGGGIKDLNDCNQIFDAGVEKIILNQMIINNFKDIEKLVKNFGSQSILACINFVETEKGYAVYDYIKKKIINEDIFNYIENLNKKQFGELMFYNVSRDGKKNGLNLEFLKKIRKITDSSIIYSGGVSSLDDISNAKSHGADAVGASTMFTLHGKFNSILIDYPKQEEIEKIRLLGSL